MAKTGPCPARGADCREGRAAFHRLRGDLAGAAADLAEALEIAERGGMPLHLCDAHLEWARLARRKGNEAEARRHLTLARQLVAETGYRRRGPRPEINLRAMVCAG